MSKLKVEMWAIDRLIPYEKNAKIHTEGQIESLAKVIKSQGWDVPIVVDREGVIIKGHGRRLAAIHMGLKEVPVICRTDMTPAQAMAARLSDNRVALTDFDTELLKEELGALNLEGFDMGAVGFDDKELDMLLKDIDVLDSSAFDADSDDEQDKPEPSKSDEKPAAASAEKTIDVSATLGFKSVPASAERDLVKFQSYAESMTEKRGPDAFAAFVGQVVAEIEARA